MKSVLISIKPKWCELIATGEKTVEVRKTVPKLDTPFKVYIYKTRNKKYWNDFYNGGKVIGEFTCDIVERMRFPEDGLVDICDEKMSCVSAEEIFKYSNGKPLYSWHISNLVVYVRPKELSEFRKYDHERIFEELESIGCNDVDCSWACRNSILGDDGFCNEYNCPKTYITRPPQSWCYVEEFSNGKH